MVVERDGADEGGANSDKLAVVIEDDIVGGLVSSILSFIGGFIDI